MANPEHVKILEEGVAAWNTWRDENPDIIPDLQDHKFKTKHDEKPAPQGNNFKMIRIIGEQFENINFMKTNLRGASLVGINLRGAHLMQADLEGAKLLQTDFRGANLGGVIFNQAYLSEVNFEGARLYSAKFIKTRFITGILKKADCIGANFKGATLWWIDMSGAKLSAVEYDNDMECLGLNVDGCVGSQRFIRHIRDLEYILEFKREHPWIHSLWEITSDCGRSWLRLAGWCCAIIYLFWTLFDILKTSHPLVTSVMAFTSFGFVDASIHTTPELIFISMESFMGYIMFGALVSLIASQMARRSG